MNRLLKVLAALPAVAALAILAMVSWQHPPIMENVPVVEGQPGWHCMPVSANNWCAPQGDPAVDAAVSRLRSRGFTCSSKPALTDHIVFQHRESLLVEVVTFDRAHGLGSSGQGWTQAFCMA